nr:MAG TPA: hypothetical protein [Caudoviricetes sp.]
MIRWRVNESPSTYALFFVLFIKAKMHQKSKLILSK